MPRGLNQESLEHGGLSCIRLLPPLSALFPLGLMIRQRKHEIGEVWFSVTTEKTMTTEESTQSYSEQWYWDNRYTNESEPFDWYQKYSSLAPLINLYVPLRNHPVLVIGCGNSGNIYNKTLWISQFLVYGSVLSDFVMFEFPMLQRLVKEWWMMGTKM